MAVETLAARMRGMEADLGSRDAGCWVGLGFRIQGVGFTV